MTTPKTNNMIDLASPDLFESGEFKEALTRHIKASGGAKSVLDGQGLIKRLTKSMLEALLQVEMEEHLGYPKYAQEGRNTDNSRNGKTSKKVRGDFGELDIESPRDRNSSFEPQLLRKREKNLGNFTNKIISLYTRGMSTREIEDHLHEMYDIEVSPQFISRATEQVQEWQNRPLDSIYPVLYVDGLRVAVRSEDNKGPVVKKCVYVVLGIGIDGRQDVLGLWIQATEGARFWLSVLNDLKARGVKDIIVACVDGLKGLPEAFEATFPKTDIQLCVVHQIRNCSRFVFYKNRKTFCNDMRAIYTAPNIEAAEIAMDDFSKKWQNQYPAAIKSWRDNWAMLTTFYQYPVELRIFIYTTNSIESLNAQLRKNTSNRKVFPSNSSLLRILYLNIQNFTKKWTTRKDWNTILNQLSIMFPERITPEVIDNV